MRSIHVLFIAVAFTLFLFTPIAPAVTPLSDPAALTSILYENPAAIANDYFGYGLAIDGNYLLAGVPGRSTYKGGYNLYGKTPDNQWELLRTHTYSQNGAGFGGAVAINENNLLVTADRYDHEGYTDAGGVSVETKSAMGLWEEQPMLVASDPRNNARFGAALCLHESLLAVGANEYNNGRGAAYLFTNTNGAWTQIDRIVPNDLSENDKFGSALAVNNQFLAIGAPQQDLNAIADSGAVYLYENNNGTWTYWKKLDGGNAAGAKFGSAIALSGNVLMIGAPSAPIGGVAVGLVYVYDLGQDSTPISHVLAGANPQLNASFGSTVALDGNLAVVGARFYDGDANSSGRATLYQYDKTRNIWYAIRELPTQTLNASDRFGTSIAVYRNQIACAAPFALQGAATSCGNFYVYDLNQTWFRAGQTAEDYYGHRVGLNGTRLAASAPYRDANGINNSGSVELFRKRGRDWTLEQNLTEDASSRAANNRFGYGMALGRNTLIVSAPGGDYDYVNNGKIYIYKRTGNAWNAVYSRTGQGDNWQYGTTVALNDSHAAATRYNPGNGATYIDTFTRAGNGTWSKDAFSVSPYFGADAGAIGFGCDIAIDGNFMVVGSSSYLLNQGGFHIYKWQTDRWRGVAGTYSMIADDLTGTSVDLCGNLIAAGSPGRSSSQGIVKLYGLGDETLLFYATLSAPDAKDGDRFGYSVAFANQGNTLLVGAYKKHMGDLQDVGAVYVYRKGANNSTWTYDGTIYPPDNGSLTHLDYFGKDIAAFGNSVAAGLYGFNSEDDGDRAGAVAQIQITPFTAPADFDGDGITDFGCYHPPSGGWYVYKSREGYWENHFGYEGTLPFVMDCDGDWKVDFGCYHSASANWYGYGTVKKFWTSAFGNPNTQSITGDFDGDGVVDLGFFDSSIPKFYFMCSTRGYTDDQFGFTDTVPISGDFDGDGIDDYGTYYDVTGAWNIRRSRDGDWANNFGYEGTLPVTGDFDGDGIMDFGCYHPPSGGWYIYKSTDGYWENHFGFEGTLPVTGDFDGDGIEDFGCYHPPTGAWYVYKSNEGFWENYFGYEGTIPLN
ncbi:MAG: hypothetical protein PHP44_01035 [Kiritimatiellae bacterium]|nr:hypothetical protein [Kiritimatiellia bacterium]